LFPSLTSIFFAPPEDFRDALFCVAGGTFGTPPEWARRVQSLQSVRRSPDKWLATCRYCAPCKWLVSHTAGGRLSPADCDIHLVCIVSRRLLSACRRRRCSYSVYFDVSSVAGRESDASPPRRNDLTKNRLNIRTLDKISTLKEPPVMTVLRFLFAVRFGEQW